MATATCAGVVTVSVGVPVRGWLNRLNRNISVKTRCTIVFSTLIGMVPFWMAVCSARAVVRVDRLLLVGPCSAPWVECSAP